VSSFEVSDSWWRRAQQVIPLGTQTLSKSPTQFVQGALPIYLERGLGSHVWDVDGNEWIDYPMALGPVLLGYCEPAVDAAVRAQLDDGITFTLMHPLEVEVAERIVAMCPGVEAVRFGKSGSDAISGAVRAARALTGRDHVLVAGYHGWQDWYIGTTTRDAGVPAAVSALTSTFPFNDLSALERALDERRGSVAAVVVEPSGAEVPEDGYLDGLIDLARRHGALSIFDEVITGFRLAPGGARERYGVEPDLSCYGKALGNGMPISAIGGRWSTMRVFEEIFFSGTHGGEALSLAAAKVVLDLVADGQVLRTIASQGTRLRSGLNEIVEQHGLQHRVRISGEPQRAVVTLLDDPQLTTKSFVQQTFAEHGVLFNGSMFICAHHSDDDIRRTLTAFDLACQTIASTADLHPLLVGPAVAPVFRAP
jgi:glutamate-1-semialdehyde aminotransferase